MENIPFENRKILILESSARIQNFMDCDVLGEANEQLEKAKTVNEAVEATNYIESAIHYRLNERPEVKALYIRNLGIIQTLKKEFHD